jgi:hypothetical protein
MADNEIPRYDVDRDTESLLSSVLELAFLTCNLQLDNNNANDIANICFQTAARFGIDLHVQEITSETDPSDSQPTIAQMKLHKLPFTINISDKDDK